MLSEIIILIAFLIRTLRNIFYHLFWWEKKEYRFDRMLVHLQETYQGKKWLLGPLSLIKWILLIFSSVSFVIYLIYLVFILEAIKNILELKDGWRIPPLKSRVVAIFLITLLSLFLIILYIANRGLSFALTLLIADKLLGPVIILLILFSNIVFYFYKKRLVTLAKLKISKTNLKVVGIAGSYGKTTTKELIAQILGQRYRVLKTLGSQNTDIGIAERILSTELSKYDYFVCEMAAYKIGEIAEICNILKGKIEIGVITGINEQHQSLFGSLENTKKAKFELIEAVNLNGTAVFNGNSKYIKDMIDWAKRKRLKVLIADSSLVKKLPSQIHGTHFQENLSLAITVAATTGMNDNDIRKSIDKVKLPSQTMNITNRGNLHLIDNTFNSNPDGVYTALTYLNTFKGNKVLVLQPLIELGKYTQGVHNKIGKMAGQICSQIVLTNKNFNNYIIEGVKENKSKILVGKLPKITEGATLFQGKEAEKYLKKI